MSARYWDPVPAALREVARDGDPFDGRWAERNWRGVPGPFYGTVREADSPPRDAAELLAHEERVVADLVYRQPTDVLQVQSLVAEVRKHPDRHYAMDGDQHWTPAAVRAWWYERGRVKEWALKAAAHRAGTGDREQDQLVQELRGYVDYIDQLLQEDLRGYLFWLEERRLPERCDRLPLLVKQTRRLPPPRSTDEAAVVAGYLVVEPEGDEVSVAACRVGQLPRDDHWFSSREAALAACARLRIGPPARLLGLLVTPGQAKVLARAVRKADGDDPVLLANLASPPALDEGGTRLGWEVIGYDAGHLHTWRCHDPSADALAELGVRTGPDGLFADLADAERVAAVLNGWSADRPAIWFAGEVLGWPGPAKAATDGPGSWRNRPRR
ncbi:hypothetical protein [Kitasatospora sp. NPDC004289]